LLWSLERNNAGIAAAQRFELPLPTQTGLCRICAAAAGADLSGGSTDRAEVYYIAGFSKKYNPVLITIVITLITIVNIGQKQFLKMLLFYSTPAQTSARAARRPAQKYTI